MFPFVVDSHIHRESSYILLCYNRKQYNTYIILLQFHSLRNLKEGNTVNCVIFVGRNYCENMHIKNFSEVGCDKNFLRTITLPMYNNKSSELTHGKHWTKIVRGSSLHFWMQRMWMTPLLISASKLQQLPHLHICSRTKTIHVYFYHVYLIIVFVCLACVNHKNFWIAKFHPQFTLIMF